MSEKEAWKNKNVRKFSGIKMASLSKEMNFKWLDKLDTLISKSFSVITELQQHFLTFLNPFFDIFMHG